VDLLPALTRHPSSRLSVDGRALSFAELADSAEAVAASLGGIPSVAVEATASLETVMAVVGALMAGVPVVPVPPDAGPLERQHILSDSGALPVPPPAPGSFTPPELDPDRVAMIVYTSGTTGLPKGVMLSASAIATDLDLLAGAWEWTPEDTLVHGLPLFHVHGLILGVLGALRVGSSLVHTGRPTPAAYASAGGTLYFGVPTVWSRVAGDPSCASALRSARLLVSGSAGLPVPVFEKLASLAGQGPVERYGMTETLITVSGRASDERRPGWVGLPLPGVSTRLADEADGIGELEVRTPTVMKGYLNMEDSPVGPDGWVRTGDVAAISDDGWHRIVGRKSTDLIKCGGYRIGAGEVEAALLAHPAVSEAAVVGAPDDDLGEVVVAYVVPADQVQVDDLVSFVARSLSVHKRPRRVIMVDELPRNAMGKVQKQLLTGG
jgi:fatty acid CoA ligase FadD36